MIPKKRCLPKGDHWSAALYLGKRDSSSSFQRNTMQLIINANAEFFWKLTNKNLPVFLSQPTIWDYKCSRLTLLLISGSMLDHSAFTGDRQSKQSAIRNSWKLSLHPNSKRNKCDQVRRSDGTPMSAAPMSDPIRTAADVQILRARSKCAVVTEEISVRRKLLKGGGGLCAWGTGGSTCSGFCRWQLGLSRYRFVLFYPGAVVHLPLLLSVTDAF